MIIIYGSSTFGKTDRLPGLFHVVTEFEHIYYVPLIPRRSIVIVEGTNGKIGHDISRSGKSILLGYLRTASFIAGSILSIWTLVIFSSSFGWFDQPAGNEPISWEIPALAVTAWTLFALSYFWNKPNPARALVLADQIGIPMEKIVGHYVDDLRVKDLVEKRQQEAVETPTQ